MSCVQEMLRQQLVLAEDHHEYQMSNMRGKCAIHLPILCITMKVSCTWHHL